MAAAAVDSGLGTPSDTEMEMGPGAAAGEALAGEEMTGAHRGLPDPPGEEISRLGDVVDGSPLHEADESIELPDPSRGDVLPSDDPVSCDLSR